MKFRTRNLYLSLDYFFTSEQRHTKLIYHDVSDDSEFIKGMFSPFVEKKKIEKNNSNCIVDLTNTWIFVSVNIRQ
jgi:hypothetical protein